MVIVFMILLSCTKKGAVQMADSDLKTQYSRVPITTTEYNDIISKKYNNPLINRAFNVVATFHTAQKKDFTDLSRLITQIKKRNKISNTNAITKLRDQLKKELNYVNEFDNNVELLMPIDLEDDNNDPHHVLFPVKTNKLVIFLQNALMLSDDALLKIINGEVINEINLDNKLPAPDFQGSNIGNIRSDVTIPSSAVVMLATLKSIDNNAYNAYIKEHLDKNAIFYWYKTPRGGHGVDRNSIFYASRKGIDGMLLVHNGYSFGDSINSENFNDKNFPIYPHDCAGYVNYLLGSLNKDMFTNKYDIMWTSDIHNLNHFLLKEGFVSYDAIREKLPAYGSFAKTVSAVPLKTIGDIKEGDILTFREFSTDKRQDNSNGISGHVGIVLGTDGNDKIYIISYSRHYEKLNTGGALISAVSFKNITSGFYSSSLFRSREQDYNNSLENMINVGVKNGQCTLTYKNKSYKCSIGKNGLGKHKVEGDQKTPIGIFDIREVFYRKDRVTNLSTKLPTIVIEKNYAWCDIANSPRYNEFILTPSSQCPGTSEDLHMDRDLYDIVVPIEYNANRTPGQGSAVFLHVATEDYGPTAGCVSMAKHDLINLLSEINTKTRMNIYDINKK